MSVDIHEQIKVLIKRGTPETDPRIQGLRRRLQLAEEAKVTAAETTEKLKEALGGLLDDRRGT